MEFQRAGTQKAPKTEKGKIVAIKQFNKFLQMKVLSPFAILMRDNDEETLCNKELYQEFGTFLVEYATSLLSDDSLSADNALHSCAVSSKFNLAKKMTVGIQM